MKILHLIDSGGLYGAERMLLALVKEQLDAGLDPVILSAGEIGIENKPIELEAMRLNLPLKVWRMHPGLNLKAAKEIRSWAAEIGVDLFHSHGFKFNVLMGLFWHKRNVPLISTFHGYLHAPRFSKLWIYEKLDRFSALRIDSLVLVGEAMRHELPSFVLSNKHVISIRNGLDVDRVKEMAKSDLPPKINDFFKSHEPLIIGVGRLSPEKGFDNLLRAFRKIKDNFTNAGLVLAGDGPERARLESMALELGLSDDVLFLGYVENIPALMARSSILVMPSLNEGLPITLLEALLLRIPIVASSVGEIPALLEGGVGVLLKKVGDHQEISNAVSSILGRLNTISVCLDSGYDKVVSGFSAGMMSKKYTEQYERLLKTYSINKVDL
ncbi:glycosyltransferase [Marinobacter shengliensis]|uniref:glycosyltransferase n=1 Tax=Marinobacter shengliensis TaxID=1389223 RepID=UPI00257421A9|nr:glycosyltransferase [Marinobacter shengliensis]BEH14455.1 glycosyl transferase [Marinobacter shengliensis]